MTTKTLKGSSKSASLPDSSEGSETTERLDAMDRLAALLPAEQLEDAVKGLAPEEITGPGDLLTQPAGRVINAAREGELTDHPGHPPGQAPPGGAGNRRNGSTPKTR